MKVTQCTASEWRMLVDIFIEMETYYHGPVPVTPEEMSDYLQQKVFHPQSGTRVFKAEQEGVVAGFACAAIQFPAPRYSGQMFIKELFVSEKFRGQGTGTLLMKTLAAAALDAGCLRLDWLSDKHDAAVQLFYHGVGGEVIESVNYFRLSGERLRSLANKEPSGNSEFP
ncbi:MULTISPECIES: GNAT family N-acetyltransferase [Tatumella]|uniref:Histone acetyltransferase n=2 Tax=Tatumella ptyseos TaxID=82987 RepID=A0A085JCV3_9GAMM|nr:MULTISPECIES: GNAT family N-acetyltransferase [Tatumella]KFD18299.1 histone acetyltransferase [Tatumella ptyseos ATCC 33301]SQK74538.1 Acetyltransferase (GNAT) family [Tatumella ptyseos]